MSLEQMKKELEEHVTHLEMHRTPEPFTIEDFRRWIKDIDDFEDFHSPSYDQGFEDGQRDKELDPELVARCITEGINELGWAPDVPNEKGEMKFGPECHEIQTTKEKVMELQE